MKTKHSFLYLLSFVFCLTLRPAPFALSQIPQGFNYQAIARDGTGAVLQNTPLQAMMYVQSELTGGTIFWKELHAAVTTNSFGLFTLVVGIGTRQTESTVATFNLIDWSVTPKYLKTEIYYLGSWKDIGTSQLLTVPYAMVAEDLAGSVAKLSVEGEATGFEDALFEVKNKNGQTIFAVYNEGVRIYVDDGAKGPKGGFAVGGFDMTKATKREYFVVSDDSVRIYLDSDPVTKGVKSGFAVGGYDITKGSVQNYLDVSADSIRMYINDTGKGKKGGFAVGGFDQTKGENVNFLNVATDANAIINPAQNRILWYPLKNAFLTGKVLIESPANVGENSFATGYEAKAIGRYSQAMGFRPAAYADYSTAIGYNAATFSPNSFAFGNNAIASGDDAYAFGTHAHAAGLKSFAFGSVGVDSAGGATGPTVASGEGSFALGFGSVSSDKGAFAFGVSDSATGYFSQAFGYLTKSQGVLSTTFGFATVAEPAGWISLATGAGTKAGNYAASAFGDHTYASGHTSFATGYSTVASGHLSATFGASTTASGAGAIAMGENTTAQAYASLVLGRYNIISGTPSAWYFWEPVFVIGNGTETTPSNAMTVYKSGIADFAGYLNINRSSTGGALYVDSKEALWYDLNHFSWGFDGLYNYYAKPVLIGGSDNTPSYTLTVQGTTNSTGGYYSVSDARWKTNLKQLENIIPGILHLNGYSFNWRANKFPDKNFDSGTQIGLIAQDVEKVFPELVRTDNNGYKAVSYEKMTVILLEGMKEQQEIIEKQDAEIQSLKSRLGKIEAALAKGDGRMKKEGVRSEE